MEKPNKNIKKIKKNKKIKKISQRNYHLQYMSPNFPNGTTSLAMSLDFPTKLPASYASKFPNGTTINSICLQIFPKELPASYVSTPGPF